MHRVCLVLVHNHNEERNVSIRAKLKDLKNTFRGRF